MKKLMCLVLSILVVFAVTGCNKGTEVTSDGDTPTLLWYLNCETQSDADAVMEEINQLIEPKIGAKLQLVFIDPGAYNEKMNMIMASGTEYDMCFTGYVNNYRTAVKQGGLMPIKDLIETNAPALKGLIPEYAWKAITVDGEVYAVPNVQLYAMPQALFIDKEMVDKYQFDYESMQTIDDLEPFLQTIKENEPDKYPYQPDFGVGPWTAGIFENVLTGMGELCVRIGDDSCQVFKNYEQPEYVNAIKKLNDWYQKGYIRKDISSADTSDAMSIDRTVSFVASYKPGVEKDLENVRHKDFVVKQLSQNYITTNLCESTLIGVSATSQAPDKVVKLIELLHSDKELYNLVCHGIAGKHYQKLDGDFYAPIKESGYEPNQDWALGNQFNSYILEGKEANVWEESKKLNDTAAQSKLLGFDFNTEKVVNEIAQCTAVSGEYKALEKGCLDPEETIRVMSQKLEDAGIDRIIEELQRQIDAYLQGK